MEEEQYVHNDLRNNTDFMSITPVIRDTLEKRRVEEFRQGRHQTMSLMNPRQMSSNMIGLSP